MLRNYLSIALRNLRKHQAFSIINISGLAIGIACCVLLSLYIKNEFSFEKHIEGNDRIYRLYSVFIKDGTAESFPRTSPPVALALAEQFPEIETATRLVNPPEVEQHLLRYKDNIFYEKTGYLVDSTFFDVFSFDFQEGDQLTALDGPSSVVLSAQVAAKIFGNNSALDELLIINSGQSTDTFRITGVLKPLKNPSHVNADFYMCMNSRGWGEYINSVTTWAWQNFIVSYVKLKPHTQAQTVEEKIPALIELHAGNDLKNSGLEKEMHLQPLNDIHLYTDFKNTFGMAESGNILYIYILSSIGIFILLIACINFMNLTTAKASQRAGEVGVRKSLGASRKNLIHQFLGESMTIVFIAMVLAIGIVQLTLPLFNEVTQKTLSINAQNITYIADSLLIIGLITGMIAGSYPAFFLSSFQPAKVLKDKRLSAGGSNFLRKGLVVIQFVISITLISSIVIIQRQLNFIQHQSLGFNPDYRIMIPLRTNEAKIQYAQLKAAYAQLAGVEVISASTSLPSTALLRDFSLYPQGSSMDRSILHRNVLIDENYFIALDIKLIAGRDLLFEVDSFSWSNTNRKIIVNRASLHDLNIELETAVGTNLLTEWEGRVYNHEIIGVVDDFHQHSLHQKIGPMIFYIPSQKSEFAFMTIVVNKNNYTAVIPQFEQKWKEIAPNTPFESDFLSDNIKRQYENDQRVSMIITAFTLLAIAISCLGLYGLSIYVAERKVKEIGIRKVLGGSVVSIVALLSKEFIMLVLIALIIAIPIGYYTMDKWLESFAYKTELNAIVFVITGLIALVIAWLTVGFESVKAALSNPVDSLRNE